MKDSEDDALMGRQSLPSWDSAEPITAFAEAVALWCARQAGIDDVVLSAERLMNHELAGPAITILASATQAEQASDMGDQVRRACQEVGVRFDQPDSADATESAARARCARILRDALTGWDLLNELDQAFNRNSSSRHEKFSALLTELEVALFMEDEYGATDPGSQARPIIEADLRALAFSFLISGSDRLDP